MRFLIRLFNSNKVDCPRCLGKGVVDVKDIKRLKKELYWAPGKCAYCNGAGKVPSKRISTINFDTEYLTIDLPKGERKKLIKGDVEALQRAKEYQAETEKIIKEIEYFHYIKNQEANQIADYFLRKYRIPDISTTERQELLEYIETVIKNKLPNQ